jgi:hypothetical protein
MNYLISEKFKLEIHWAGTVYNQEGRCELIGAYFTGPALQIAQKINDKDHMMLDLYSQYLTLVKGVYVIKFEWSGVTYKDVENRVYLNKCYLTHTEELNIVPKLKPTDYFVIDTSDHEFSVHKYSLVYKTILIKEDHLRYRFNNE